MREWKFRIETLPVGVGTNVITAADELGLYGMFLLPPENQELVVVFLDRGLSEKEQVAEDERQRLMVDVIAAGEMFNVHPTQVTEDLLAKYRAQVATGVDIVDDTEDDGRILDFKERVAAIEGYLAEASEDDDDDEE